MTSWRASTARILTLASLLVLTWLLPLGMARAQVQTESIPPPPTLATSPAASASPKEPLIRTGVLDVAVARLDNFRWRYLVTNGTQRDVTGIHMVVPADSYDSRVMQQAPAGWVARRQRGEGALAGSWLLSWFSANPAYILPAGRRLALGMQSGGPMLHGHVRARVLFAASEADRLLFPWDADYVGVPVTDSGPRRPEITALQYPSFEMNPPPGPDMTVAQALRERAISLEVFGEGRHAGEAFLLSLHAERALVAHLARGTLLVPSLPGFDFMMVGRDERLALNPGDQVAIRLRGYSTTYGRRAPPPRLSQYDIHYALAELSEPAPDGPSPANVHAYQALLQRADRVTPRLVTPAGQDYPDLLAQWAIWRQERIFEGQPLGIRDLEKDLTLYFRWVGTKRAYLSPLQVRALSKQVWADTDTLLYRQLPAGPALP